MADNVIIEKADKNFQDLFLKSKLGPKVLGLMLDICHFGEIAENDDWQISQDFMKIVLDRCGISFVANGEKMVRALMLKKENVNEDEDG